MEAEEKNVVLSKWFPSDPHWKEGYKAFHELLGRPLGWLVTFGADRKEAKRLDRLDRCPVTQVPHFNEKACEEFLEKFCANCLEEPSSQFPKFFRCHLGQPCVAVAVEHANQKKGFVVLCSIQKRIKNFPQLLIAFKNFVLAQTDSFFKGFELESFYETIHPRALALSTIHSVHRALSTSMKLEDLVPRITRLCAQVLQASYCAMYLVDDRRKFLVPKFVLGGGKTERVGRITIGKGLLGEIAKTGDVIQQRNCVAVPLIEEDVIGIIVVRDKYDHTAFKRIDVEILKTLAEQAQIAIRNAELFEDREKLTLGSIESINKILRHRLPRPSPYTPLFFRLTLEVAKNMGLAGEDLSNLHRAISLLNVGHAGIPAQILQKKGKLTEAERKILRQHPVFGANIVRSISSLKPIVPVILHHRERYDGTGYPSGLRGEEIPIGARIVAVTDAFSAMLSERPYRPAKTVKEAIEEVKKHSGSQFDPKVVECFLQVLERDPELKSLMKG